PRRRGAAAPRRRAAGGAPARPPRPPPRPSFNRAMRALNHLHCFVVPLDPANGLPLDRFEPGLGAAAAGLAADGAVRPVVAAVGGRYLGAGGPLLHADWF